MPKKKGPESAADPSVTAIFNLLRDSVGLGATQAEVSQVYSACVQRDMALVLLRRAIVLIIKMTRNRGLAEYCDALKPVEQFSLPILANDLYVVGLLTRPKKRGRKGKTLNALYSPPPPKGRGVKAEFPIEVDRSRLAQWRDFVRKHRYRDGVRLSNHQIATLFYRELARKHLDRPKGAHSPSAAALKSSMAFADDFAIDYLKEIARIKERLRKNARRKGGTKR